MNIKTLLALAATVFFWSSAFVGIRVGLDGYSAGSLALLRYLVASVGVIPVYFMRRNRQPIRLLDWPRFIIIALCGFTIYNIALNHGEITIHAGIASFIVGLIPVFTVLLAVIFLKERFSRKGWIGVSISFLGVVLIAIGEHAGIKFDMGVIYTLIAALSASIYAVTQKPLLKRFPAMQVGAMAIWIGTFFLLIYTPDLYQQIQTAPIHATTAAIYMGIFPGVIAYMCWTYALSQAPASQAATALYAMPIVTTIMGYLYLSELPALYSLIGGLLALLGAFIVNRSCQKKTKKIPSTQEYSTAT